MGKVFILRPTKSGIFLPQQYLTLHDWPVFWLYSVHGFFKQSQFISPSIMARDFNCRVFYAPFPEGILCTVTPSPFLRVGGGCTEASSIKTQLVWL